ncbi:MAG: hypothetical protein JWL60_1285 [Gemmatimonadetes bacterium]|jgi:hypothetical protein|nr:hypothetical protein [Gemmatimonadota bacterium]
MRSLELRARDGVGSGRGDDEATTLTTEADMNDANEEIPVRIVCVEPEREWEVRAIRPQDAERRARLLPPDHANGWLLFSLGLERRRLAPVPPEWHNATETQLKRWWEAARPVKAPSREGTAH